MHKSLSSWSFGLLLSDRLNNWDAFVLEGQRQEWEEELSDIHDSHEFSGLLLHPASRQRLSIGLLFPVLDGLFLECSEQHRPSIRN